MALWGGRFEGAADPRFTAFNDSLPFDARLAPQDVAGSIAWAGGLRRAGVLDDAQHDDLVTGLRAIHAELEAGVDPREDDDEDVHAWVERRLTERLGDLGRRLHTGRSRNDQVATDLRLWTREAIDDTDAGLAEVQGALLDLAERERETVMPGYTHLQRAQPVLFAHWCLAYVEMLDRDRERFADARRRVDRCPLGCGALAGTTWAVDRDALAADLGFAAPCRNSLDAVSDRDFVIESLAAASITAVHLSRMAEDLVFFASGEAAFVHLDDSVTSGSSLMPQKKNPDSLEGVRGRTGPITGALVSLLMTMKGLALAYDKDMQEDKVPLFTAMDHLHQCLAVTTPVLERLRVDRAATAAAARAGHANATELADYLVGKGVPFRTAHELSGAAVRAAIEAGGAIEDLPLETLQAIHPAIEEDVRACLALDAVLARRDQPGGTAPARVAEALAAARERISRTTAGAGAATPPIGAGSGA